MKKKVLQLAAIMALMCACPVISCAQGWEGVGNDWTPGDSWVPLCLHEKDGYIFFGDIHVGVFRYEEATKEWTQFTIPGNINIVYDMLTFDDLLWCCTDGNGVFSSDDNGATWMDKNLGLTHHKVYTLAVCNDILYCGTYHGGYFRYDNGTGAWSAINTGFLYEPNKWYALEISSVGEILYQYGIGIGIYNSTDYGEGWYPLNNIYYDANAEVHDFISHKGYLMISADYQGVMRSTTGGLTWDYCNEGFVGQQKIKSIAASDEAVFAGSADSGVYVSRDAGDHWVMASNGFPWNYQDDRYASVYSMEVIGEYLYAGVWWNGVWRAKVADLVALADMKENESGKGIILRQNRPNPFKGDTEISYFLASPGQVSLKVYDISGRVVTTLVDSRQDRGEHTVPFSLPPGEAASGGVLYYRLVADGKSQSMKMLLVP
jgi:photosystem II stability/assembly factor-like uncharacterized protein